MEGAAQSIPICPGGHRGHGGSQEGPWVLQGFTALKLDSRSPSSEKLGAHPQKEKGKEGRW